MRVVVAVAGRPDGQAEVVFSWLTSKRGDWIAHGAGTGGKKPLFRHLWH